MNRTIVESSLLTSIGYDPKEGVLEIEFPRKGHPPGEGSVYQYDRVPVSVWQDFQAAESHGKFFLADIKGKYAYRKIEPNPVLSEEDAAKLEKQNE